MRKHHDHPASGRRNEERHVIRGVVLCKQEMTMTTVAGWQRLQAACRARDVWFSFGRSIAVVSVDAFTLTEEAQTLLTYLSLHTHTCIPVHTNSKLLTLHTTHRESPTLPIHILPSFGRNTAVIAVVPPVGTCSRKSSSARTNARVSAERISG